MLRSCTSSRDFPAGYVLVFVLSLTSRVEPANLIVLIIRLRPGANFELGKEAGLRGCARRAMHGLHSCRAECLKLKG